MNVVRDAATEQLLDDSKKLRGQLADAVNELDRYVHALQQYVERLPKEEVPTKEKK